MIKRIVDRLRRAEGYAGMAVYRNESLLFHEGWDPGHAARIVELHRGLETRLAAKKTAVVIQGYTVSVFSSGALLVACRSAGRFTGLPALPDEEPEFTSGQAPPGLISREEARREAQAILKSLLGPG